MGTNLYSNILNGKEYINSHYMILHFIASVIIIYFGCSGIGLVRQKLFDKPMRIIASKVGNMMENLYIGNNKHIIDISRLYAKIKNR